MQLDKTAIAIRERSSREIFDLTLVVLRNYWQPLLAVSLLAALPVMVFNVWILSWMLGEDAYLAAEANPAAESYIRIRYLAHLAGLCIIQFPLVSLPVTIYLGSRIFYEPITIAGVFRKLGSIWGRCTWVLGIYRLGVVTLGLIVFINRADASDPAKEILIAGAVGLALLIRSVRPFAPEILALELCPLKSEQPQRITYSQRSKSLHRMGESDNIGRFLSTSIVGLMLGAMLTGLFLFSKGFSTGNWTWTAWADYLYFPVMLWAVGLYLAVYRFLAYLDTRIRQEGWEIELRLKAEAGRMQGVHSPSSVPSRGSLEKAAS